MKVIIYIYSKCFSSLALYKHLSVFKSNDRRYNESHVSLRWHKRKHVCMCLTHYRQMALLFRKKNTQLYFSSAQVQASCVCSTWKETIAIGSSPPLLTPFLLFFNFLFSLEETFQLWCTPQPLSCCLYITCVCEWIVFHSRAKNRKKISFVCHSSISIKITARRSSLCKTWNYLHTSRFQ